MIKSFLAIFATLCLYTAGIDTGNESNPTHGTPYCTAKFDAVIDVIAYGDSDPVQIVYQVHPHGGSGYYAFRWRLYGSEFDENGTFTHQFSFPCLPQGKYVKSIAR